MLKTTKTSKISYNITFNDKILGELIKHEDGFFCYHTHSYGGHQEHTLEYISKVLHELNDEWREIMNNDKIK